jgi:hypothetical protein
LERWESGQSGIEELLAQHPERRSELEPLLRLAAQLRAQPPLRAPERLRRDPLWRRGLAPAAQAPVSLPDYAAARATPPAAHLEPHEALAVALERWERGEPGVDAVLAEHPEVQPLVELAVELWSTPPVQAPARLRQDPLWRRAAAPADESAAPLSLPLWAAARRDDAAPAARPASVSPTRRQKLVRTLSRLAAGVGGAGLSLLLAGSLATSTATSLPDEALYPVKRLVEDAQLAVAPPEARLEIRLQRAQERMKETREMVERARADVVASLATDYVREVDAVRTELHASQAQTPAPEQVGRVITRLEANEQMLGAIVQRVPEPARPAVARAVEVSRPESVTAVEPAVRPAAVAAPAAPEPAAVAPPAAAEPPAPAAIVPAAAPTFGPASVALPSRSQPSQGTAGSQQSSGPGRVTIPSGAGAAPALLPGSSSAASPQQRPAAASGSTSAGAGTTTAPGSVTTGSASGGTTSSTTGAPLAAPFGSAGAVTGSSPAAGTTSSAATSPSSSAPSSPGSVTTGGASASTPSSPASTTGSQGAPSPSSTQRAPSFDAPPAQATAVPVSPTPVYQLLPPAATPTRATP